MSNNTGWIVGTVVTLLYAVPFIGNATTGDGGSTSVQSTQPTLESSALEGTAPLTAAEMSGDNNAASEDAAADAPAETTAAAAETTPAEGDAGQIDADRVINAEAESWLAHGRTYSEQRFSPLAKITTENVDSLGLAWSYETTTIRGLEASPIVVDGVMYASGSWSKVYAVNAKTGEEIWTYDPEVPGEWGRRACCDVVNRGVAVWKGRVYFGTLDGRLIALNAESGDVEWEVQTTDRERFYTITGAPRVVNDKVIIGNGGTEYGVRGYITAYAAETGDQVWRFYTVPGDPSKEPEHPEMAEAAKTWSTGGTEHKWWEIGGGGTAWDSMAYDPELNLLYVGVGNGSPWTRWERSPGGGDNLYLSSIIALNPDTGRLSWHYQTTPGDNWDYTATQHMILADLVVDGQMRQVIMQAPKNGFFYVIDRTSGELLRAEAYTKVTWATHVDMATGRPVENPDLSYKDRSREIFPGPAGGHNWHPMAYSPMTQLVYLPVHEESFFYSHDQNFKYHPKKWNTGNDFAGVGEAIDAAMVELNVGPDQLAGVGSLKAWDPVAGKARWQVAHDTTVNGGLLATAGNLVFQGTGNGRFMAINAETGQILKSIDTKTGIIAPPITYLVDGEQYVAVMAGWGGGAAVNTRNNSAAVHQYGNNGRILVFKLDGDPEVPPQPSKHDRAIPEPPSIEVDAATLKKGEQLFRRTCAVCHGFYAVGNYDYADLRYSPPEVHEAYEDIVLGGILAAQGMASFADVLDKDDVKAIQAYVVTQARRDYDKQQKAAAADTNAGE